MPAKQLLQYSEEEESAWKLLRLTAKFIRTVGRLHAQFGGSSESNAKSR
jgi:hypothetical protein